MTKHLQIGITGGIGAGKSIISSIFSTLGTPVYDADSRARWLMNNKPELKKSIVALFGQEAYEDNFINRKLIGSMAFSKPELLEKLNLLVHPKVNEDYLKWVRMNKEVPYSLKEAALLFESGSFKQLDATIYVSAPESLRIQRVLKRDPHRSKEDIRKIISNQWPEEKKIKLADFVIKNDLDSRIIPQVLNLDLIFRKDFQAV